VTFRTEIIGDQTLILGDCRDVMSALPQYDLLLTDPPYGIRADENPVRGKWGRGVVTNVAAWDRHRPCDDLIKKAVDKAQHSIVWGGNYFADFLPPSQRWLVWDKITRNFSLADCELAWTNYDAASRIYTASRNPDADKQHPTQKPLELMKWCLGKLAKNANTVLDPFMGSGTTLVACQQLGRKGTGIELSEKYFDVACKRVEQAAAQPRMFVEPVQKPKQEELL